MPPLDQAELIAFFQQRLKGCDLSAAQGGPSQDLASGATSALFYIAMELAQLNLNTEALTAAIEKQQTTVTATSSKSTPTPAPAEV
jgi:hypothetical protein